jgi:mannose-6-phosphate isomerase-like protein (cupin superfamily)
MRKLRDFLTQAIYERAVRKPTSRWKTSRAKAAVAFCCAMGMAWAAHAQPKAKFGDERRVVQAVENALQKHGADVHRCFEKVLADHLDAAGMVEVTVDVGKAGKVISAKVKKIDKSASPALATCVEKAALGWSLDGIEAGASVVLPFSFKAQSSQFLVNAADVPERALGAPATSKAKAGPKRAAPFTVKVLADATNVKAEGISVTLLSVGPASRVAMHRHPHSAKILYLVSGHARLLGPEGTAPAKLDEGAAAFIPGGYPHVIENMSRQSTAVFLQAFSPPGPERVYRDPTDPHGRAEFEVIRDPASAKASSELAGKVAVATAAEVKSVALPRGIGSSKNLIEPAAGQAMSLAQLELVDGAEIQSKGDASANQVLYFVSGTGSLKVAGETLPLSAEALVYLPHGTPYAIKFALDEKRDKIMAVQLKVTSSTLPHGKPSGSKQ